MSDATQQSKRSYKDTLNLPKTSFAMKANLVQNEPATLKRWQQSGLYERIRQSRAASPRFVFHDGPPYANGSIHLGHLLNKVLKDLVVRSRTMMGLNTPYIPGWDCHGLPIEHKVVQDLGDKARTMVPLQIRQRCKTYAEKFVKLQGEQMQRLLTLADYEHPYLTMLPAYEGQALEVFAELVARGLVYRDLKPVHWSIANRTALADAELEHYDREDTSIFVLFEVENPAELPASLMARPGLPLTLMIWTTTPWTLPANLAVAAAPRAEYGLYRWEHEGRMGLTLVACQLASKVFGQLGASYDILGSCTGSELEAAGVRYRHPFIDRVSPLVTAEYVTLEDGTGLVHTAPGHGVEDYQTGLRYKLPVYCPVLEDGTFDATAPAFLQGKDVWTANDLVLAQLRETGNLFHSNRFMHSYPHDWRGKTPVIFRATEQWFVGVDREPKGLPGSLRKLATEAAAHDIKFYPEWGRNRLKGMLESRPDWCISRQRAWGLPIPAFFGSQKGQVLLTPASIRAVAAVVRKDGSDAWYRLSTSELLAGYNPASDPDAPDWVKTAGVSELTKSVDIFDVWFDSGVSWAAVIRERFGSDWLPTDLYLEGSDQHRGWFQASLLPALGATGKPPFKALLTHGFMVDKDGKKMSKSLGNTLEVEELLKEFGADVCRWWVCSLNTDNDIKVDLEFFKVAGEEYRKVRNTLRILLANLGDFKPAEHTYKFSGQDQHSLDAWALGELQGLVSLVRSAYENFAFSDIHKAVFDFCNETLSAVYVNATKDRLYCDSANSPRRRRTQTAMFQIADALIRMLAPILPHTAEEAWASLHGQGKESVHLALLPADAEFASVIAADFKPLLQAREHWLKTIEGTRQTQGIDNPLDLGLRISTAGEQRFLAGFDPQDLADLLAISRVEATGQAIANGFEVLDLRQEARCERSWKRDGTVKPRSDGGLLSDRDAAALGL